MPTPPYQSTIKFTDVTTAFGLSINPPSRSLGGSFRFVPGTYTPSTPVIPTGPIASISLSYHLGGKSSVSGGWIAAMNFGNGGRGLMVATDDTYIYVAGQITGTATAWNAAGTASISAVATTGSGVALVQYNTSGTPLWITVIDGAGTDLVGYISCRGDGIYVSGRAGTTWPTAKNASNPSIGKTITGTVNTIGWFIAKYNSSGDALYMIGTTAGASQNAHVFEIDYDGAVFAAGRSGGSGQILNAYGPGGSSVVSANAPTFTPNFVLCWIARWDTNGTPQWIRFDRTNNAGGYGTGVATGIYNFYPAAVVVSGCGGSVTPIAYDGAGNVLILSTKAAQAATTTCVSLTQDFGGAEWMTVIYNTYINDTVGSACVASYPGYFGKPYLEDSPYYVCGTSVSGVAPIAYSAGTTTGVTAVPVPTLRGAWLAKFSWDGQVLWIATIDGPGDNYATAVNVDSDNFIYVNVTVTDQNTVNAYNAGSTTSFVTSVTSGGSGTVIVKYDTNGTAINTCISYNFNTGGRLVNNLIVTGGNRYKTGSIAGGTFNWQVITPEGITIDSTNQQVGILAKF